MILNEMVKFVVPLRKEVKEIMIRQRVQKKWPQQKKPGKKGEKG